MVACWKHASVMETTTLSQLYEDKIRLVWAVHDGDYLGLGGT